MLGILLDLTIGAISVADSVTEEVTGVSPVETVATGSLLTGAVVYEICKGDQTKCTNCCNCQKNKEKRRR